MKSYFSLKKIIISIILISVIRPICAMERQSLMQRIYSWWQTSGERDFVLYAFPVSRDTNGRFYVLVKDNGTGQPSEPFYSLIQHRPWRTGAGFSSFSSSAVEVKAGGVSLRKHIPNVAIYFDRWGRPKLGLGNVRQYYDESNQAWMAEELIKGQTNGYFTKGNGLLYDTGWLWGKTLGYTKRACFMNKDIETGQDKNIVVFLMAEHKSLAGHSTIDGKPLKWRPIENSALLPVAYGAWGERENKRGFSEYRPWIKLLAQYWFSRPYAQGWYTRRPGALEILWGIVTPADTGFEGRRATSSTSQQQRGQSGVAYRVTDDPRGVEYQELERQRGRGQASSQVQQYYEQKWSGQQDPGVIEYESGSRPTQITTEPSSRVQEYYKHKWGGEQDPGVIEY